MTGEQFVPEENQFSEQNIVGLNVVDESVVVEKDAGSNSERQREE